MRAAPTTTTDGPAFARAVAFERRAHGQVAEHVATLPYGHAFLSRRLPLVFYANLLWVTAAAGEVTADDLLRDADRMLAGFEHRWAVVEQEPLWRALATGLIGAGWRAETHVYMAHARKPDLLPATLDAVREVQRDDIRTAERRFLDTLPWCAGDAGAQVLEHHRAIGELLDERCFAVYAGDDVCAYAKLRHHDGVAQIEDVVVLPGHRGTGLGRLVTTAALVAALRLEPELLFIVADDDDWPKRLYARLGFDPIGRTRMYHVLP